MGGGYGTCIFKDNGFSFEHLFGQALDEMGIIFSHVRCGN